VSDCEAVEFGVVAGVIIAMISIFTKSKMRLQHFFGGG
jgi:hypothetical protein